MKTAKITIGFLFIIAMSMFLATLFQVNVLVPFIPLLAASFFMPQGDVAFMALQKEIWQKDIVDNLFKNNEFALRAFNADMYVLLGKVVHIPVAGAAATVKKNLTEFPQTAVKRTDSEITYAIDTFYSMPRQIEQIEKYELSYDKRQSVLGEDQQGLIETAMENLLYRWAPLVANTVLTDGAATLATVDGGTGNRKKFTKAALATIKLKMDKAKIPVSGRVALLTADHYNQFLDSLSEAERTDVGRVADLANGVVGKFLGFDIMMRSSVLRYRGADGAYVVVDELDAAYAASDKTADRGASLVYHDKSVERAKGSVEIFENGGQAEYYGDVFSMLLRLGGRIRRTAGVYAVVEAAAAA